MTRTLPLHAIVALALAGGAILVTLEWSIVLLGWR